MRAVIQRVISSRVEVDGIVRGAIERGLLVLIGVHKDDGVASSDYIADKIINLRIFEDALGKMNLSLAEVGGKVLIVSQFTLYGDARKGRRPGFSEAAAGIDAESHYMSVCEKVSNAGIHVEKGIFGADMQVHLINDGPVTILLDSDRAF